jgi:hypothetical protein
MLDNLRESASQSPFFQEDQKPPDEDSDSESRSTSSKNFLGMTPVQRFILALMLFMVVCIFGAFILIVTQRVWL